MDYKFYASYDKHIIYICFILCFMSIIDSYKKFTFEEFGLNIVLLNYILHDINICSFNVNIYLSHR